MQMKAGMRLTGLLLIVTLFGSCSGTEHKAPRRLATPQTLVTMYPSRLDATLTATPTANPRPPIIQSHLPPFVNVQR